MLGVGPRVEGGVGGWVDAVDEEVGEAGLRSVVVLMSRWLGEEGSEGLVCWAGGCVAMVL